MSSEQKKITAGIVLGIISILATVAAVYLLSKIINKSSDTFTTAQIASSITCSPGYTDTFNTLNTSFWSDSFVWQPDAVSVSVSAGNLLIKSTSYGSNYIWPRDQVTGDFSTQVDITGIILTDIRNEGFASLRLMNIDTNGNFHGITIDVSKHSNILQIEAYSDFDVSTNQKFTKVITSLPVTLKIIKKGSTVDTYYNVGNGFVLLGEFPNNNGFISLEASSDAITPGITAKFDNFKLYCESATPTTSPSPTLSPSPSASPRPSLSPSPSPSASPRPSLSPSPSPSLSPTISQTAAPYQTLSPSPSPSTTPTGSQTPTLSSTPSPSPTPSVSTIACGVMDVDGDGYLTLIDFRGFAQVYGAHCNDSPPTTGCGPKDANGDKVINILDFISFSLKYSSNKTNRCDQ